MLMKDRAGNLHFPCTVDAFGPRFCSLCGSSLRLGATYTRLNIYSPMSRQPGMIARCVSCFPIEEAPPDTYKHAIVPQRLESNGGFERLDTAIWGNPDA